MSETTERSSSGGQSGRSRADFEDDPLSTPVQFSRGVGPQRAKLFENLGIHTVLDLLLYLPRDVLDLGDVRSPSDLEAGEHQTVCGTVVDRESRQISGGRSLTAVLIRCDREFVRAAWFNQPWMLNKFRDNQVVVFSGKPKRSQGRWEFSSPHVQWIGDDDAGDGPIQALPQYGLTDGLRMQDVRRIAQAAVEDYVEFLPERIPPGAVQQWKLPNIRDAVRHLHMPESAQQFHAARRRLMFEDLLEFQLGVAIRRRAWWRDNDAPILPTSAKIDSRIRRLFPFQFTPGQNQAVKDIVADMSSGLAMHRLLQADVGAGKTAIAMYGMLVAVAADFQAALMAPTELLASQHWQTIDTALANSRVKRALLTGNLTPKQRKKTLQEITDGEVQLVVGTQALIQQDIRFSNLGLAVIDEQHRFGVGQRAKFSLGDHNPHVLVMTATPIPRSLCLTQFGDLDLTVVADMPPGRQPVRTWRVQDPATRTRAWSFIRERLSEGRQLYVVCPRVGEAEDADQDSLPFDAPDPVEPVRGIPTPGQLTGSTEELFRELKTGELEGFVIGMIHGRMNAQKKADTMDAFRTGELQVLVSTTVIEVGVDVPNSTLMVVQQAERFGLSQLHQLRGRIGRGSHQGYCFLFSDATNPDVVKRLDSLEKCSDGFRIAEVDFELRGPGDILGKRQHGAMPLRFARLLRDRPLVEETRNAAFDLVESGRFDEPDFVPLKTSVLERFGELMDLPRSG